MSSFMYLRHVRTGEVFAVIVSDADMVEGSCGPLSYRDILPPVDMEAYHYTDEDNDDFNQHKENWLPTNS
jgi:hypothetical protein